MKASRLAVVPASLLVAVAVWEIVATRRYADAVPDDVGWSRAASVVRQAYRPGDLIVFAPAWADPIGRLHLGDLIPLEMAGRMDSARYGRIWQLSIRDAVAPDVAGLAPVEDHEIDGVTVRRYERAPAVVVADVVDAFATARRDGGAAHVELAEVAFEPHRCVVVAALPDKPVRVTFPNLALGSELVGYVGIADVFTRRDSREPVELTVEIAGATTATATAPIDRWVRFRAATAPGVADVAFAIRWTGRSAQPKQVCFAAEARR